MPKLEKRTHLTCHEFIQLKYLSLAEYVLKIKPFYIIYFIRV
nr:MAG TPA: hypothetical protein [Caudoviricetes sp.]